MSWRWVDAENIEGQIRELPSKYMAFAIERYTNTALLLNANQVARRHYQSRDDPVNLSTTMNIPPDLRLDPEIDRVKDRAGLIEHYGDPAIQGIASDYLVSTVATLDAFCEDIYRLFVTLKAPDMDSTEADKLVRSIWWRDTFRRFLEDEVGLRKPANRLSSIQLVLDRYQEWRAARHAILHGRGQVRPATMSRLARARTRLQAIPSAVTIFDLGFVSGSDIRPDYWMILVLRKWSYEFLGYWNDVLKDWRPD